MPFTHCRVRTFLDEQGVRYQVLPHRRDFTASETAQDTRTPGKDFAKCVLLRMDGKYALAVMPAHHAVDLEQFRRALGATDLELAGEDEMLLAFPDCDVGAEPPFGNLYDIPVYLSVAMADDRVVTFNAGSHEEAVRMEYDDFVRLVRPRLLDFSRPRAR